MKFRLRMILIALSMAISLVIVHSTVASTLLKGTTQTMGAGTAYSYIVLNRRGNPSEVGVVLSEAALQNLPNEETELDLILPQHRLSNLPFTHVGLNWNPRGHLPPPIYGTPHFDFHFYIISQAERQQITATGEDLARTYKTPDARYIPTGYVLAPESAVPQEGSHWIDPQAREFQGQPHGFDYTMIYGFYNGQMNFVEPMMSLETLQQHRTIDEAIARPTAYQKPGLYPSRYSLTYNPQTQELRIALTDLR